ncbi:hypothetical protein BKA82DRAFT_1002970 [Pisolithus tinctorius]|uniref:Uncharacterized protein n=1 Tax=Pisolithus tinctorius Marx 270 TaxID=870435 RepID=A0A0C3NKR2_PISTI|nr:hypothetical protein BKA82DRAFT_1002970 [Pisolithus tinctorius]KIO01545.1 hypothetical protein M404DRAFT_1002970 [Pisolithus tinctorius Marx 270]
MVDGAHVSMSRVRVALLYVYEGTCTVLRSTGGRLNQRPQRFSSWCAGGGTGICGAPGPLSRVSQQLPVRSSY